MIRFYSNENSLFDIFFKVERDEQNKPTNFEQLYPIEIVKNVNQQALRFCFPVEDSPIPDKYSFAVKCTETSYTYGYVIQKKEKNNLISYCILSSFIDQNKIFSIMEEFINNMQNLGNDKQKIFNFINSKITHPAKRDSFLLEQITINSMAQELFKVIDIDIVGTFISSIALDERIIVSSQSLNLLSRVCFALISLIYPLKWPGVFIPVLPFFLTDTLLAPFPFIIGVHTSSLPSIEWDDLESHIFIDIDSKEVQRRRTISLPLSIIELIVNFKKEVENSSPLKTVALCRKLFLSIIAKGLSAKSTDPNVLYTAWNNQREKDVNSFQEFDRCIVGSQSVLTLMRVVEDVTNGKKDDYDKSVYAGYWPEQTQSQNGGPAHSKKETVFISTNLKHSSTNHKFEIPEYIAKKPTKPQDPTPPAPKQQSFERNRTSPHFNVPRDNQQSKEVEKGPESLSFHAKLAKLQQFVDG